MYRAGQLKDDAVNFLNKKYGVGTRNEIQEQVNTQSATFAEKVLKKLPKADNYKSTIKKEINKELNLLICIVTVLKMKVRL